MATALGCAAAAIRVCREVLRYMQGRSNRISIKKKKAEANLSLKPSTLSTSYSSAVEQLNVVVPFSFSAGNVPMALIFTA